MRKLLTIIITLVYLPFSNLSFAQNMLFDGNILSAIPDAGGSDDFRTGKIVQLNYNYYVYPWLALTSGLFYSETILDSIKEDIVGTYQASIETSGITLGIRPQHKFSDRNKVYGRVGLLLYDTKLSVEEYFEPGLPTGTNTDSTNGYGYFIGLGWAHSFTPKISFQLELQTQNQLDLFDGKTNADNVFDLKLTGFSIGMAYAF